MITPVAAIGLINTTDGEKLSDLGAGFVPINVDLNRGAGGDYILLAYRKSKDHSDDLLTGLMIWDRHSTYVYSVGTAPPPGWNWIGLTQHGTSILQDLNEDASGEYIYLYYTNQFVEESALPGR